MFKVVNSKTGRVATFQKKPAMFLSFKKASRVARLRAMKNRVSHSIVRV